MKNSLEERAREFFAARSCDTSFYNAIAFARSERQRQRERDRRTCINRAERYEHDEKYPSYTLDRVSLEARGCACAILADEEE